MSNAFIVGAIVQENDSALGQILAEIDDECGLLIIEGRSQPLRIVFTDDDMLALFKMTLPLFSDLQLLELMMEVSRQRLTADADK